MFLMIRAVLITIFLHCYVAIYQEILKSTRLISNAFELGQFQQTRRASNKAAEISPLYPGYGIYLLYPDIVYRVLLISILC